MYSFNTYSSTRQQFILKETKNKNCNQSSTQDLSKQVTVADAVCAFCPGIQSNRCLSTKQQLCQCFFSRRHDLWKCFSLENATLTYNIKVNFPLALVFNPVCQGASIKTYLHKGGGNNIDDATTMGTWEVKVNKDTPKAQNFFI